MFLIDNFETIIVGGSQGIGKSLVSNFCKYNAKVTNFDIIPPKHKSEGDYIFCDISIEKSIDEALNKYFKKNNIIKVLINSAAITLPGESSNYNESDWFKTLSVNLNGIFFLCQKVGKNMIDNQIAGSIINFTSIGAMEGFENNPAYAASKGGVRQLTKSLAVEWGKYGIRVNNLVPGYTNTPMNKNSWNDPVLKKQREDRTVFGRWAETEEMAGPAIFLASSASSYITGIDLVVDGGWLIKGM